jgi:Mn-dependent DtxR family transcriptional regulator
LIRQLGNDLPSFLKSIALSPQYINTDYRVSRMPTVAENQVLALLAKEWDYTGPPGILDISDVVAALPLAPSQTLEAVKTLFANGLIDMNKMQSSAFLTPEGYAVVKGNGETHLKPE